MKKLDINNKASCATCGARVTHPGENWEAINESVRQSALNAPNPDSPTYVKQLAEVESVKRSGGWQHLFTDVSHDPAPHDGRTMEEERDRIQRGINSSTDSNLSRFKTGSTPPLSAKQQKGTTE
jgi:hypothetical protein